LRRRLQVSVSTASMRRREGRRPAPTSQFGDGARSAHTPGCRAQQFGDWSRRVGFRSQFTLPAGTLSAGPRLKFSNGF
jgi:hypothetical protein